MKKKKVEDYIQDSKKIYESTEIPEELENVVINTISDAMERREVPMKKYYGRKALGAAAAIVICFTIGLNTSESFAVAAAELPIIGSISRVLVFRSYETEDEDKNVKVRVPKIQVSTDENQEFAVDVNQEIQKIVKQYEEEAAVHIAEYKEAFLDTGGTEAEFSDKGIKVDVSYEVKYETEEVLSLVLTANENWCGAYGVQYYYNLNLKDGVHITLKDLLGENYVEIANASITAQMQQRMEEDNSLEYWDGSDGITGFETVSEDTKFYINSAGNPVVVFEKYEIAPGAFGIQEFEISRQ